MFSQSVITNIQSKNVNCMSEIDMLGFDDYLHPEEK